MVERVLGLMESAGINATELSKITGVGTTTVSAWKKGLQKPSTEAIVKIAKHFGVTTDYLLIGEEEDSNQQNLVLGKHETEDIIVEQSVYEKAVLHSLGYGENIAWLCKQILEKSKPISDDEFFRSINVPKEILNLWADGIFEPVPTQWQLQSLLENYKTGIGYVYPPTASLGESDMTGILNKRRKLPEEADFRIAKLSSIISILKMSEPPTPRLEQTVSPDHMLLVEELVAKAAKKNPVDIKNIIKQLDQDVTQPNR